MQKLSRVVEGYNIQFVNLPKIFGKLSQDLPSGSINLGNGESAYFRITRQQFDGKGKFKPPREVAPMLFEALQAIVQSKPFMNQYGLTGNIALGGNMHDLIISIRNLLTQNQHTVTYSSTSRSLGPSRGVTLSEEIDVPLSNLVHVVAVRGGTIRAKGQSTVSGVLYLNESDANDDTKGFKFKIISPFVDLATHVGPQRLTDEITSRLKKNLGIIASQPHIVYDEGIFDGYVTQGLAALENKRSNKSKKPAGVPADSSVATEGQSGWAADDWKQVLTEEQYRALSVEQRRAYLELKGNLPNLSLHPSEVHAVMADFLTSAILAVEYRQHTVNSVSAPLTQEYFIARKIGLTDAQVQGWLAPNFPKFVEQLDSSVPVGDKAGDNPVASQEAEAEAEIPDTAADQAARLLEEAPVAVCEGGACELTPVEDAPQEAEAVTFVDKDTGEEVDPLKGLSEDRRQELDEVAEKLIVVKSVEEMLNSSTEVLEQAAQGIVQSSEEGKELLSISESIILFFVMRELIAKGDSAEVVQKAHDILLKKIFGETAETYLGQIEGGVDSLPAENNVGDCLFLGTKPYAFIEGNWVERVVD